MHVADNAQVRVIAKIQLPLMEAMLSFAEGVSLGDIRPEHSHLIEPLIRSLNKNIAELQRIVQGAEPPKAGIRRELAEGERAL